ncbi:sulfurtransferase [Undibacterium squillarum]|uniref:sulfurtransferase n=1 Tax=Undibacterium squillarum TaxID=1131567 RepID=UPI0035B2CE41
MFSTLISVTQLQTLRSSATPFVLLDCRHELLNPRAGADAYAQGHLPGALFVDIDTQLSAPKDGPVFRGRHPLPSKEQFIQTMRALGISDQTQVIAYDAHGGMFAARLWWMLRWVGHAAVAVLDGGLAAWQNAGLPLTTDVPVAAAGSLNLKPALTAQVDVGFLVANLTTDALQVVDARAPDRFRGQNETIDPVGGHIPGAINRFFKDNLQADGSFKPAEQLRAEWQAILPAITSAVMQCGSGVTACHNLLALEHAGLPGAALYPGSWSEWCADPSRPVAT